jgi:DNA-binding XRE family transcriptional regulator
MQTLEVTEIPLPNNGICQAKDCVEKATIFAMFPPVGEIGACGPWHGSDAQIGALIEWRKQQFALKRNTLRKTVGGKIHKWRTANNVTQEAMGIQVGRSRAAIGRLERGSINVSIVLLEKISNVMGIKLHELLNEETPRTEEQVL